MTQYAIKERAEGATSAGAPFLRLTLSHRNGELKAVYWDVPAATAQLCQAAAAIVEQGGESASD